MRAPCGCCEWTAPPLLAPLLIAWAGLTLASLCLLARALEGQR